MPRRTQPPQQEIRRMVDRLRALQLDPPTQRAYALELLRGGVPSSLLPTVIDALGPPFDVETRPLFIETYRALAKLGGKGDPGGEVRARLIDGITANATAEDRALFLETLAVREASLQLGPGPQSLHAAALRGMRVVDDVLAGALAVQFLNFYLAEQPPDKPRRMSVTEAGEPLVTALRVMFDLGQDLAIFQAAALEETLPPVVLGEALRLLVNLPPEMTWWLIERHAASASDEVAAGAFDLALASPDLDGTREIIQGALCGSNYDIAGYVAMCIAALRNPDWLALLFDVCDAERRDRSRLVSLLDAVRAVRGDPRATALVPVLEERIVQLRDEEGVARPGLASESDEEFVY